MFENAFNRKDVTFIIVPLTLSVHFLVKNNFYFYILWENATKILK